MGKSLFFKHGSNNGRLLLLMVLMGGIPLAFSSMFIIYIEANPQLFELELFPLLVLSTISAIFLIGLALMPSTVAAIVLGYYLQYWGLIPVFISYPLAALLGLMFSGLLLHYTGTRPLHHFAELKDYVEKLESYYFQMIVYLRISPVLPFAMMNVFLASLPIKIGWYVLGSMVGMLPRTLLFFWLGMNARDLWEFVKQPTLEGVWQLFPIVFVLLSLGGLLFIAKKVFAVKSR